MSGGTRIAQVMAGAAVGGAEKFYTDLAAALAATGKVEQTAFTRPHADRMRRLEQAGIAVSPHRFGGPLDWLGRRRLQQALRRLDPQVVLTWMNRASQAVHPGPWTLAARLGHYYDLKYYRHADHWIGISRGICDHLIRGGCPAHRVHHLPNFADENVPAPLPRRQLNTSDQAPLLLAAGRLHHNKGFDVLLDALAGIPDAVLWLAGSGPLEAALKAHAADLGIAERTRFLGWRDDITALMRSADLFVCPSRSEGLGTIVLEAWAHHCPIVATASQGPAELLQGDRYGITTPVDDADALRRAIRTLLDNPQQRTDLADRAFAHYQQHFSRASVVQRYLDLFDTIRPR